MPLKPVTGKLNLPVNSPEDVQTLFEVGRSFSPERQGKLSIEDYRRDLSDHLHYIGAVCPQYFRPLQEAVTQLPADELINFQWVSPAHWLYLLQDAPDSCADHLVARLMNAAEGDRPIVHLLEGMLAGICTPYALRAMARYVTSSEMRQRFQDLGFWMDGADNPAVPRFIRQRQALRLHLEDGTADDVAGGANPVGLPVSAIVSNLKQKKLVWHYCSFDLRLLPGMPALGAPRLHLVSPPYWTDWTVFCAILPGGLYDPFKVMRDDEGDIVSAREMRADAKQEEARGRGYLDLLPYDDQLTYSNGHTMLTPGAVGDIGGPPILGSVPACPTCGKTMFFVSCVGCEVREFGDGWRNLYVCEDCMIAACQGLLV